MREIFATLVNEVLNLSGSKQHAHFLLLAIISCAGFFDLLNRKVWGVFAWFGAWFAFSTSSIQAVTITHHEQTLPRPRRRNTHRNRD